MTVPYISSVAALIGDPTRGYMLCALKSEGVLKASELANIAGVAPNTASEHLAKLVRGRLIEFDSVGRCRSYRLAGPEVADALEALEFLSVSATPSDLLIPGINDTLRFARICYDHLAGHLAVRITKVLLERGSLKAVNAGFEITARGEKEFTALGIDLARLRANPRQMARSCPDWTEKQPHLGGSLGAAVFGRFCELNWMAADRKSLKVSLTDAGRNALRQRFGIALHMA